MSEFTINGKPWNNCIRSPYEDRFKPPEDIYLWLDDVRPMPEHYTHWAKTAQEAIEILKTGKVVECSLDHDLGTDHETGYTVAKYIEESAHNGTLKELRCRVHSQNPVGAQNIKMALRSAYVKWEEQNDN